MFDSLFNKVPEHQRDAAKQLLILFGALGLLVLFGKKGA